MVIIKDVGLPDFLANLYVSGWKEYYSAEFLGCYRAKITTL